MSTRPKPRRAGRGAWPGRGGRGRRRWGACGLGGRRPGPASSPASSVREDAKLTSLSTWALVADDGTLAGFGQFYLRVGRCHLGRLAIAPDSSGQGLGATLVRELCRQGSAALGVGIYSLFVVPGNERALRLYRRLGFLPVPYPEPKPAFDSYLYMVTTR